MERKPDIQYIDRFYVHGSEARVLELKPKRKFIKTILPKAIPDKSIKIAVDPVALCGIAVAAVMLVLLVVGMFQYVAVCESYQQMMDQVITLQNENVELEQTYRDGYDLADIEQKALALGMIPVEEAEVITIQLALPEPEPEWTLWDEIVWFCKGLFA